MFGYIKIEPDQLKGIDKRAYRKMYCGLCHQIGEYSQIARLSLSFDMAFFLILSAYDHSDIAGRCVEGKCLHHIECPEQTIDYWAAISVIMIWHKFHNDVVDGEKLKQGIVVALNNSYKHAASNYPEADRAICESLQQIAQLENIRTEDAEAIMAIFGALAMELVNSAPHSEKRDSSLQQLLGNIACEIGKWIYCMDFYDDLEQDKKKGQYNPLLVQAEKEALSVKQVRARFRKTIDHHVEELQRMCAFLPYEGFQAIILNVLHEGVVAVTADVYSGHFRSHRGR